MNYLSLTLEYWCQIDLLLANIIFHVRNCRVGQEMVGDGKSLMEQLRGEALKFHKAGEEEPKKTMMTLDHHGHSPFE